jgi:FkbM family methyltransferase
VALPRVIEETLRTGPATAKSLLIVDGDVWVRAEHRAPDMVIVRDILFDDAYRLGELRLRPRTVLDVGAHIGCLALRAHQRWPGAEVVCVEPNPANMSALDANVGRFAKQVPRAATYDPGPVRLVSSIFPGSDNTGASYVLAGDKALASAEQNQTSERKVTVEAVTLEALIEELDWTTIDLLKLDCEGCEFSLLERTESLDKIGAIVGEYHDRARFDALIARRFSSWELRRITDGEPGLFWLINPAAGTPRES